MVDKIEPDDYWGFLASPQKILGESQHPRRAPAREAGVVDAWSEEELGDAVRELGQQGRRIVTVFPGINGAGYQIVWQEWS